MPLTLEQVHDRIANQSPSDLPLRITADGDGYAVTEASDDPGLEGISDHDTARLGDKGIDSVTYAGYDVFEYHASYTAPRRDNYEDRLIDLKAGLISAVTVTADPLDYSWVFGVKAS